MRFFYSLSWEPYNRQIIFWVRIFLQCDSLLLSHFILITDKITLEASPPSLEGLLLVSISKPYLPLHGLHIFGANTTIFTAWLYRIIFLYTNLVGQILFHKLAIIRSSIKILIHRMRKLRARPPWGFYVAFWKVFPLYFPLSICNENNLREYYYKRKKAAEYSAAFLRL